MNKRLILMLSTLSLCVSITGCSAKNNNTNSTKNNTQTKSEDTIGEIDTYIKLGSNISIDGEGAANANNKITITKGGTYSISGTLEDGQIIVDAGKEDDVELVLDNANITCSNSSPIYVKTAKNAIVALADNSKNSVTDGKTYVIEDENSDEPNATIFSKDDLKFIGNGTLVVNSNYNNGITSKDDLKIKGGTITVNSVGDGIRGKDSVTITDGNINITSSEDGIKSSNTEDESKGYVLIEGGKINITSGQDGIQAETKATISNGNISITSGGGSENSSKKSESWGNWGKPGEKNPNQQESTSTDTTTDAASAKAIKANNEIIIDKGDITIDSSDDAIHSNDKLTINGGNINIASGDDGIHSDSNLDINNGNISITKSYEGIESQIINIKGGEVKIVASDDGINAAGGNDSSSINGRPGQNNFSSSEQGEINISGGDIYVDASGDGLDANGSISMTEGLVIVNGPTNNGNGALDYDGNFEVSGGTLIAAGSAGMAQTPSESSTQNSVSITLSQQEANSIVNIKSEDGEDVITFAPSKQYQTVVVTSPKLKTGSSYTVSYGGKSTGEAKNGLYSGGEYSGGTEVGNFKISSSISKITESGVTVNSMQGPGGGKGFGRGGEGKVPPQNRGQAPNDMQPPSGTNQ